MSERAQQPPLLRSPNFQMLFCNHSRMRVAPGEFGLYFGMLDEMPGFGPAIEEKVAIQITPVHAKLLRDYLTGVIEVYEETHGKIPGPSGLFLDDKRIQEATEAARERNQ